MENTQEFLSKKGVDLEAIVKQVEQEKHGGFKSEGQMYF